jgi:transcriptional regulator with XRE-family HTH domain
MSEYDSKEQRELGARIRQLIKESGLTRQEVSDRANMGIKTLRKYINGLGFPKSQEVVRLSYALGTSPNYLLTGSETFNGADFESKKEFEMSKVRRAAKLMVYVSQLNESDSKFIEKIVTSLLASSLSKERMEVLNELYEEVSEVGYWGEYLNKIS